jgi:hypothetical protein
VSRDLGELQEISRRSSSQQVRLGILMWQASDNNRDEGDGNYDQREE